MWLLFFTIAAIAYMASVCKMLIDQGKYGYAARMAIMALMSCFALMVQLIKP